MSLQSSGHTDEPPATGLAIWKVLVIAFGGFVILFSAISFFVVVVVLKQPFHAKTVLLLNATQFYLWLAFAPVVFVFARRHAITRGRWRGPVFFHVCASLPCAFLAATLAMTIFWFLDFPDSKQLFPTFTRALVSTGNSFATGVLIYWALVLAAHGLNYYRSYQIEELRTHQLRAQLSQAQLQALRMQLQPHFLFNTLHSINDLVLEDPEAATKMITRLGDFLRMTLEGSAAPTIPLQQELEFLNHYLEIEKLRFHQRLLVEIKIAPDVLSAQVPNFILQPLVENALRHGVPTRLGPSRLKVTARRSGQRLELSVQDDGPGFADAGIQRKNGLGLSNTSERLKYLYGEEQSLAVNGNGSSGAAVTLTIPFTTSAPCPESTGSPR
jgi:two-component system, LytTR family, sensor kinase